MKTIAEACREQVSHAEAMGKPVVFPDIRHFVEVLGPSRPYDVSSGMRAPALEHWPAPEAHKDDGITRLSSGCAVRYASDTEGDDKGEDHWLTVDPPNSVIEWVGENMLLMDRDTLNFSVVMRRGGTALILVSYNIILGSKWLAIVDARTVP